MLYGDFGVIESDFISSCKKKKLFNSAL